MPILGPAVARAAGGKSWAYQALTWAGWPRLEGGPGHHLVPSRIPPARPGPPTNHREGSIPRPECGGACQAAEAVESPVRVFSRVRPP